MLNINLLNFYLILKYYTNVPMMVVNGRNM